MSFSMKDLIDPSQPTQVPPQQQPQATTPAPAQAATPAQVSGGSQQPNTVVKASPTSPRDPNAFSLAELTGDDQAAAQNGENDPQKTGEITNDVGNTVIVPKDGESFADTMKRATTRWKSLKPEQQQSAIDKETATMPKKTAETLGAAATIGVLGPATLAIPGEIAEAVPSVLTHTIEGVKAIGAWATKNPVQAYLLFQVMKELVPGAKKAMGVVKGVPEVE
jgi:hypothetical protein